MIDFDNVLLEIGQMGRYQLGMYLLLCIPATIPAAFIAFQQVFIVATPDHWCWVPQLSNLSVAHRKALSLPPGESGGYDSCTMYDVNFTALWYQEGGQWPERANASWPTAPCRYRWEYDTTFYDETLTTKFDLVCADKWQPGFSITLFFTGSLFGNVLFGWMADKWGRRTGTLVIMLVAIPLSILCSFSTNFTMYMAIRTVVGFTFPALYQIPFILALELMGPAYRTFAGMVICVFFAFALALLAGIAYLCRHWFVLSLSLSVPWVLLASYYWIMPESPRWLIQNARLEEAERIVQKIAKVNKKPIPTNYLEGIKELNEPDVPAEPAPVSMRCLVCGYPNIRKKFLIITFSWTANAIVYNGLSYNATDLGVSDYLAFFISAMVEVPSYFIVMYTMERWGRRLSLCATMLLGGLACVSCIFVPKEAVWWTVTLAMIGKFGIAGSFAVIYVFSGELLPTVIRSQAMAVASFFAGIGLLIFPQILELKAYGRLLPVIIMGSVTLLGAFVSFFLPETLHQHLPETMEEGENFGKGEPNIRWRCWKRRRAEAVDSTAAAAEETLPMTKSRPYNGFLEVARRPNGDQSESSMRALVS
ncbi:carcinine transporter-like [Amphibalanus amphitrite]|uniref:carcinine transporter-like n=1 Tax=Amphibalanus amphitrite TaxID=1232801 RepID=UPI001C913316|nr:carcinine transporter-like [Amphibalanus amphitrite]